MPRKRSAQERLPHAVVGEVAEAPAQEEAGQEAQVQAGLEEVFAEFQALLKNDPALDEQIREQLEDEVRSALKEAAASPAAASVPGRADWMGAIETLKKVGDFEDGEANDLIRQLDGALQPLQKRESQLAIEFSRRLATDGQEKAIAWFQQASKEAAESQDDDSAGQPLDDNPASLRNEVVNSRSRRPRGPPRRR